MKYCCNRTTEAKTKPSIELSKQNKTVHRTIEAKGNYAALPPLLHPLIIAGFCHSSHDLLSQNFLRISSIDVVRIRVHGLPIGMDHMNNGYGNDFTTPALLSVVDACKLRMLELILYRSSTQCQGSFTYSRSDIACKELGIFQLVFATLVAGNNPICHRWKVSIGGLRMLI